ncbi:MAG: ferrous iron transporter B [Spirochaetes bacterium]|nr:ferrous iron transporter B [Spirochaetota bacterium]
MQSTVSVKNLRVALVGNPNAGKTTVFNALCGARQRTGNYAGVTVEKKLGNLRGHEHVEIIDLPGTYSLKPKSADEEITERVLAGNAGTERTPDLAICVLDASNLKRSLYLCLQLKETGVPIVGALTMSDIASRRGLTLDIKKLSQALEFPVYPVTMADGEQIAALTNAIAATPTAAKSNNAKNQTIEERYAAIDKILRSALKKESRKNSLTQKIDALLTHRVLGLVFFTAIIGAMFYSIYAGARPIMDGIDAGIKTLAMSARSALAAYPVTASLISDGIIAGVGSVFVFLPQIAILFFFISVLEETGYLARAAFLMDKLLAWTGLNGRAFIPLLSSFACAVPGILSARVMPSDRARMATILIAPLMSCSARLPVYVLFIGAFIEPRYGALWAAATLFGMHLVGIAVALPLAWLLNRKVLKTGTSPFILELPEYRKPHWPNVWRRVYDAAQNFLRRVGGIIFALSIVIWALAYFPHSPQTAATELQQFKLETGIDSNQSLSPDRLRAAYLRESFLGRFGRAVEPAFAPLGFDWKISVAVLSAFPAREVFISTLGIIFSVSDAKDDPAALGKKLLQEKKSTGEAMYSTLLAISVMIFFALCAQCMSTLATIRRELNSTKWAVIVFVTLTSLAYVASLIVYQVGSRIS